VTAGGELVVRPSYGTGRYNASYERRPEDIRPHVCAGGRYIMMAWESPSFGLTTW